MTNVTTKPDSGKAILRRAGAAPGAAVRRRDAGGRPARAADERGAAAERPVERGAFEIVAADRVKRLAPNVSFGSWLCENHS
jgi:hypothetical protein